VRFYDRRVDNVAVTNGAEATAQALRLRNLSPAEEQVEAERLELQLTRTLPESVRVFIRFPQLMASLAEAYEAHPVFPEVAKLIDGAYVAPEMGPVLWLITENQGVCAWGVPLTDERSVSPVLVGQHREGDLPQVLSYAATVDEFVQAWNWDGRILRSRYTLQAQAAPLDDVTRNQLRLAYKELGSTYGWPGDRNLRYEAEGLSIALWDGRGQCDWWIVSDDISVLESHVTALRQFSNLERALWSNDEAGMGLLERLGVRGPLAH
jgi:hypothetical protein